MCEMSPSRNFCFAYVGSLNDFKNFIIFQDARHAAEEEIYTNLNQKIDQFLQLADYDWMTGDLGNKASDYLVDLIAFLRSTFAVFTHLPVSDNCFHFARHTEKSSLKLVKVVCFCFSQEAFQDIKVHTLIIHPLTKIWRHLLLLFH